MFVVHQERAPADRLPACPPPPVPQKAEIRRNNEPCLATVYIYRQDLRVTRFDPPDSKKKTFMPEFFSGDQWHKGSGPEVWPFYGSIGGNGEDCIIEVEGEKCVDALRSQGMAAITHPGHQRDSQSCTDRYKMLAHAGIKTVYFISDNDAQGRKYAEKFAKSAQAAGITLKAIPAETIWTALPEGGSVDDMPAEQLTTLIPAAIKSAAGATPAPIDRASYAKLRKALQEFHEECPDSSADAATGIADIATTHGVSVFDAKRIWDSIQEDQAAEADALSATSIIAQRRELEQRRQQIKLRDYFPEDVCSAIETLGANLNCDPLLAVSVVINGVAGAVKAGHRLDAGDGLFVKSPILWLLLCGASGSGKTPVMQILVRERFRLIFNHYREKSDDMRAQWELEVMDKPKKMWGDPPEELRTCVTDFTTESLNGIIADNHSAGLGTYMYSEEVKEIIGNFDEYKTANKGRGKETFLCLFDGNVNIQHRVGRRSKNVQGKVQASLLGGIQPGVFRQLLSNGDAAGLYARCLVVGMPNRYVEPNFFRTPAEIMAIHLAEQTLDNFYLRCLGLPAMVLRLDEDATRMFAALSKDTYDKTQSVPLDSQKAVYGKRLGYILQMALTLHLLWVACGEASEKEQYVSRQTLAKATMLVDLLQSYAIVEQEEAQMTPHGEFDLNRKIHSFAKVKGGCTARGFRLTCVTQRLRKTITTNEIAAAMERLVQMGLGDWHGGEKGGVSNRVFLARGEFPS